MSLYTTLQKTKEELPDRLKQRQQEAEIKRQAERIATAPAGPRNDTQAGTGQTLMGKGVTGVQMSPASLFGVDSISQQRQRTQTQRAAAHTVKADTPAAFANRNTTNPLPSTAVQQTQDVLNRYRQEAAQQRKERESRAQSLTLEDFHNDPATSAQYGGKYENYLNGQKDMSSAGIQAQIDDIDRQIEAAKQGGYGEELDLVTGSPIYANYDQIEQLKTQRGGLEAQLEFAKTREWEEQQKTQILEAGGEELLAQLREYDLFKKGKSKITGEEARGILNGLWEKGYSEDQIMEMVDFAARLNSEDQYDASIKKSSQFASEHPVLSSLGSVAGSLTSGFGMIDVADQNLRNLLSGKDTPVNYKTPLMEPSGATRAIRGQVASDIEEKTAGWVGSDTPLGNLYSDFYQLSMSMADSLGAVGLKAMGVPYAGVLLGGSAATNAMTEAKDRGASDAQALTMGLLAGVAETVFEQYSIEKLFSLKTPATKVDALMNILKQAFPEASEEFNTTIANTLSDMLVMGDKSQYETDKRRYMAQGMTAQEAAKQAGTDWFNGLLADTIGGFVSGGLFGTGSNVVNSFQNSRLNAAIQETLKPAEKSSRGGANLDAAFQEILDENNQKLNIDNTESQAYNGINENGGAFDGRNNQLDGASGEGVRTGRGGNRADSGIQNGFEDVGQGHLSNAGIVLLSPEAQQTLTERGIVNVELHDSSMDNAAFSAALDAARAADSQNGWAVTPKDANELTEAGTRTFMDRNGSTGFAIATDGDIEAVFANKAAGAPKGATKSTMPQAIANGGNKLDCYGETLVNIYARYGFVPVARVTFNPEYANPGWTADKGMPDIYFMMHNGDSADAVVQNMSKYKSWSKAELDALPLMEYDEAYQYRDSLMHGRNGGTGAQGQDGVGDMGAKTSEFRHEVKETKSKTLHTLRDKMNVPENQRQTITYDTVSERESMTNARNRLEQDFEGEEAELRTKPSWTDEEMDMGAMIQTKYRIEAMQTGDFSKYQEWERVFNAHRSEAGRSLHALRKYARQNGDSIVSNAARTLDEAKTAGLLKAGTDENEVLMLVSGLAEQFDEATGNTDTESQGTDSQSADSQDADNQAVTAQSVESLMKLIRDTSAVRRTGSFLHNKLSKTMNWAMDRIAGYAVQEIESGNYDGENYTFLKEFAAAGIESIAGDYQRASVAKGVNTVRKLAMLSKAATFMRNLAANNVFDPVDSLARNISVPLDMLLSKFTGTRSVAWDSSWFSAAKRKGSMDGLAKAIMEVGLDVNADHSKSKYEQSGNRTFKMNGASNKAVGTVSRLLSTWEKFSGYSLTATDEFQKGGIAAEVQRGVDKLYEKGLIKDDSLKNAGEQEALYRTFQDDTRVARGLSTVRKGLNFGFETGLGDALTPFVQVPANLAVRSVEYSPVGLLGSTKSLADTMIAAKNGKLTAAKQAKAVQSVGRGLTGTGLLAVAVWATLNGFIRVANPGGDDENKDKAAFEKMQGLTGTQVNWSSILRAITGNRNAEGDDWRADDFMMSIAFLDPFNSLLTTGALIAEDIQNGEGWEEILKDTAAGALQSILDLPMMDELRSIQYAYQRSDADNVGGKIVDVGAQIAADYAASFIPNALKGIAQGTDKYQRDLYTQDSIGGRLKDQVYASIPGLRQTLPAKQDSFGRDMENEGGVLNFLNANLLPGQITTYKTDDLLERITDLSELTGQTSVFPKSQAPEKITVDGEDFLLDQSQQREYQQIYGKTEYDTREALFDNEYYQGQDQKTMLKAQSYAEDYATQTAKGSMEVGFEPDSWVQDLSGKSPEEVVDAIMLKTFQSLADDKKTYENRYDGIGGLLETGKIDDAIALSLCSESLQEAYYEGPSKAGVTVQQWVDTYSYATSHADPNDKEGKRAAAVEYANSLDISQEQRTALVNGMYSVMTDYIPKDVKPSNEFLLSQGQAGIETIEANMSESQRERYETYIKKTGVDMETYLYIWDFAQNATSDRDENGKETKSAQEKVIDEIEKRGRTRADKRNLFLSMGYSEKNLPYQWR